MTTRKKYQVCADAPKEISGIRHDGPGSYIELSASQAAHPLRTGQIRLPVVKTKPRKTRANGRNKR
jgi:hypothetical protein